MTEAPTIAVVTHKVARRIRQWPSKIVHQIYSIEPIRSKIIDNRNAQINSGKHCLPPLTAAEADLVNGLKEQGFSVAGIDTFDGLSTKEFLEASSSVYAQLEDGYRKTGMNVEIRKLLAAKEPLVKQFETIFRAGLDIGLLKIAEHYLQGPVAYGGVDVFFTIADGAEKGARLWHKDGEDNPMLKVAVYLNDVGDDDGPFEILHLPEVPASLRKSHGFGQQELNHIRNGDDIGYKITSFTGGTGTVVLCDTSKYFHRGKPAVGQNRKALFYNYYAARPLNPYFCPQPPFAASKMKDLVSDLSETQRAAALWRENLTGFDRIVTKKKPYLDL